MTPMNLMAWNRWTELVGHAHGIADKVTPDATEQAIVDGDWFIPH